MAWPGSGARSVTRCELRPTRSPPGGGAMLELCRDLRAAAGQREATVIITIDQAEELFGYSSPAAATRVLRLFRAALDASDHELMAMATLRSDFLSELQPHPAFHDPAYDHAFAYQAVTVDPMPERNFAGLIIRTSDTNLFECSAESPSRGGH